MDLVLAGFAFTGPYRGYLCRVYRNDGNGIFTGIESGLPGQGKCFFAWGDFDNDGDLDILISQDLDSFLGVYRNDGNCMFTSIGAVFLQTACMSAVWGDYDNDGDLDILAKGSKLRVYRNNSPVSNTPPTSPSGLVASVSGSGVRLSWTAATDMQTPSPGLTYNVRVGRTPGGADVVSPQSSPTGRRLLPAMGNAQHRLFTTLTNLPPGCYYWSVQGVDSAFAGSAFSPEAAFCVVQPRITSIVVTSKGNCVLGFRGVSGTNYVLEGSTNLSDWTSLTNLIAKPDGSFDYTDDPAKSDPVQFYRLTD